MSHIVLNINARKRVAGAAEQRGAVLFIALMLLIILTLLGLSAAQVTSLQERMASIYRSDGLSFQNAEHRLASIEHSTTNASVATLCDRVGVGNPTVQNWLTGSNTGHRVDVDMPLAVRGSGGEPSLGSGSAGGAAEMGGIQCFYVRISALGRDTDKLNANCGDIGQAACGAGDVTSDPTSTSIVQSIYIP
ncbi:MAG: PilX N-terminal domain-containing pilus assembly protein [Lysobacteraceae bacterium]